MTSEALTSEGLVRAARLVAPLVVFVLVPLVVTVAQVADLNDRFDTYGFDFRGTLWQPAGNVLDGRSPYPRPDAPSIVTGNPSVYPPLAILALVPLARIDFEVAYVVWTLALIAAVVGALLIAGVRDWRCHSLALMSPPVVYGIFFGNITLLLLLPLALAWRWRAEAVRVGIAVATLIAVKPFLLPLVFWLVLTRRLRGAVVAVVASACSDPPSVGCDRIRRPALVPATPRSPRVGIRARDGLPPCGPLMARLEPHGAPGDVRCRRVGPPRPGRPAPSGTPRRPPRVRDPDRDIRARVADGLAALRRAASGAAGDRPSARERRLASGVRALADPRDRRSRLAGVHIPASDARRVVCVAPADARRSASPTVPSGSSRAVRSSAPGHRPTENRYFSRWPVAACFEAAASPAGIRSPRAWTRSWEHACSGSVEHSVGGDACRGPEVST